MSNIENSGDDASTQETATSTTASTQSVPTTNSPLTSSWKPNTPSRDQAAALEARYQRLQRTSNELEEELKQLLLVRSLDEANAVVKEHISLLTKYNDIKDVGQALMGLIAEQKGLRVAEVMRDFDVGEGD